VQLQQGSATVNDPDRFARVQLAAHPGVQAPLGWSLSKGAVADIVDGQLTYPAIATAMATIRSWLQPGVLTCGAA